MDVNKLSPSTSSSNLVQRHVWISGRVQGVGFRASTVREASRVANRLKGYVRNLPDGRVEAVFSGRAEEVLALVAWCRRGPAPAQVIKLEVKEEAVDPALPEFGLQS